MKRTTSVAEEWSFARKKFSGREALRWEEGGWSYEELAERVNGLAATLLSHGIASGEPVGVHLEEQRFWSLALLAIAQAGAIYVPLDPAVPRARLEAIVGDSGLRLLISDNDEEFGCEKVSVNAPARSGEHVSVTPTEGFALLYTSGSTGDPKGVLLSHVGVLNEVTGIAEILSLGGNDRVLQFTSPGFDASLEEILSCLLSGATLVPRGATTTDDFKTFTDFVSRHEITVLDLPTAFWAAWCGWLRDAGLKIPSCVRAVIIGGERCSGQALSDWHASMASHVKLINTYGPTEASIVATYQIIEADWNESGDPPIGQPLPGYKIRLDKREEEEWGELWIGGIGVGPGYWRREELTKNAFKEYDNERWYLTGDKAKWDDRGRLIFGGRVDDQLKIRGHRVEPNEVIMNLESHEAVSAAHVGSYVLGDLQVLAAWIKLEEQAPSDWVGHLREHLRGRLSEALVPTLWAEIDEFPLTERGKLDKKALPEPKTLGSFKREAPETATENKLAELWKSVIGIPAVHRDDDFFDLGGSSLLALSLFGRISKEFGVNLPLAELLRAPTLSSLASLIDASSRMPAEDIGFPALMPLREGSGGPSLFCVHGGDGGVLFYRELAANLPPEVQLLAIESPELSVAGEVSTIPIEEMAKRYYALVKRHQPTGPYYLAGYSFGGVMVYEMSRLILASGEKVAFLGLFDTENPSSRWRAYRLMERMRIYWQGLSDFSFVDRCGMLMGRLFGGVATNLRVRSEVRAAKTAGITPPNSQLRMLQVREAHGAAMDAYVPTFLDLEMVLFKTESEDDKFEVADDYGWSDCVRSLQIVDVPGEHLTMFEPQHVVVLAEKLRSHF